MSSRASPSQSRDARPPTPDDEAAFDLRRRSNDDDDRPEAVRVPAAGGDVSRMRFESRKSTAASRSDVVRWCWRTAAAAEAGALPDDEGDDDGDVSIVSTMAPIKSRVNVSYVGRNRLSFLGPSGVAAEGETAAGAAVVESTDDGAVLAGPWFCACDVWSDKRVYAVGEGSSSARRPLADRSDGVECAAAEGGHWNSNRSGQLRSDLALLTRASAGGRSPVVSSGPASSSTTTTSTVSSGPGSIVDAVRSAGVNVFWRRDGTWGA